MFDPSDRLNAKTITLIVCVTSLTSSCAGQAGSSHDSVTPHGSGSLSLPSGGEGAVDGEIASTASELTQALHDDAHLSSVAVIDGKRIVVYWPDPADQELQSTVRRFPDLPVEIRQTRCVVSELTVVGNELLADDRLVRAFSTAPDGSKMTVLVDESVEDSSSQDDLEHKYAELSGCPVDVEFGNIVPAQ